MKKLLFLLSLVFVMLAAAPQANAGPPGDVQQVCLSVDVQTAVVSYDLAILPDAPFNVTETVLLMSSHPQPIVARAVTYTSCSYLYDPPDRSMIASVCYLNCLMSLNHKKISLIRGESSNKVNSTPLDPPHY